MIEDRAAEDAVFGAVLVSDRTLRPLIAEVGLKPENFCGEQRQRLFAAMIDVADAGDRVDAVTLASRTGLNAATIDALASRVPDVANAKAYGRRVVEVARWRRRHMAGLKLIDAAKAEDVTLAAEAEAELAGPPDQRSSTFSPKQLEDLVRDEMIMAADKSSLVPLLFPRMSSLARLRRGQMMLIGGWTSHGKTVALDQTLERCAAAGLKTHLYLNEMTPQERVFRIVARQAGVPTEFLENGSLGPEQSRLVDEALSDLPFGITDAAGWTAHDITRHMGWHKWDVVGLDILHLIEYEDEGDLRQISRALNQATKPSQANCALIATVHLNDARAVGAKLPRPTGRDIKGASALRQDTDKLLFVYREQDADGTPLPESTLYLAKNRQGRLGGFQAHFNDERIRFEVAD